MYVKFFFLTCMIFDVSRHWFFLCIYFAVPNVKMSGVCFLVNVMLPKY